MIQKRSNACIVNANAPRALKRLYNKRKCTSSAQTALWQTETNDLLRLRTTSLVSISFCVALSSMSSLPYFYVSVVGHTRVNISFSGGGEVFRSITCCSKLWLTMHVCIQRPEHPPPWRSDLFLFSRPIALAIRVLVGFKGEYMRVGISYASVAVTENHALSRYVFRCFLISQFKSIKKQVHLFVF